MENMHVETMTMVGFGVAGALMILLPIVVFLVWRKRTKASIVPTIAGTVEFFVSVYIFEQIPILLLFNVITPVADALRNSVVLYYIVGALLAGLFEETGRFITMRFILKKYKHKQNALSFGIGHGGIESVIIGISMLAYIAIGVMINSGNIDSMTQGMDGNTLEVMMTQLQSICTQTFGGCMLGVVERLIAMTIHVAFSLLVFRAVHDKKCRWFYPFAIFLHALFDFTLVLYAGKLVTLSVMEVILAVIAVSTFILSYRFVYKPMPEVVPE